MITIKKALLIIDMQIMPFIWKDYGGKPLYRETELVQGTKALIVRARQERVPVVYIMYTEAEGSPRGKDQPLWQVHPELAPLPGDPVVVKYHADSFYHTDLLQTLRERKITDLVVCGVQTEYCIDTTCKAAYSHGFGVELAMDLHSTYDAEHLTAGQIIRHHHVILEQFAAIRQSNDIVMTL